MKREYEVLVTVKIAVIAENETLAQRDAATLIRTAISAKGATVVKTET